MQLTVIIPTFNRAPLLERALRALQVARGTASRRCEIVVVDNNSSDATRDVAARAGEGVRYVFEPRQGLSHARNAGIDAAGARAPDRLVAFTDDDVEVAPEWIGVLAGAFEAHPGVPCVGGRVLPRWTQPPPAWLSPAHWAPLALQDHGPQPRLFDAATPLGLIGANVAFRSDVFDRIGLFSTHVQRVRDSIGSTEDHELLARLYASGGSALYVPDLIVRAEVPGDRLTRAYHRRWHRGHGRCHARMRLADIERSRAKFLGVPAHLFRTAARDAASWLPLTLAGDASGAFARETRLCFFSGFVRERCSWLPRR